MRPDLTSAEIAMSGSYFDHVLRDPRHYGIENTTDKVRRRGAVRRTRDDVCTERIGDPVPCSSRHLTENALLVELAGGVPPRIGKRYVGFSSLGRPAVGRWQLPKDSCGAGTQTRPPTTSAHWR